MSHFKTLLLATAVGAAGLMTSAAHAGTYVTTHEIVNTPDTVYVTRVVGGRPIIASSSTAILGTRKVGMVGSHPYPIEAAHVENTTVRATPHGLVERTEVTHTGGIIDVNHGGDYYTATDGSFYADPAWNVNVHSSGGYND